MAATCAHVASEADRWRLRDYLLAHDSAWPILALDARGALAEGNPERAPEVGEAWDHRIEKRGDTRRFFELMLNACDGPALLSVCAARADDLKTLGVLPWWDHARHPDAPDDLREALARRTPAVPVPGRVLARLRDWMEMRPPAEPDPDDPGLNPLEVRAQ